MACNKRAVTHCLRCVLNSLEFVFIFMEISLDIIQVVRFIEKATEVETVVGAKELATARMH